MQYALFRHQQVATYCRCGTERRARNRGTHRSVHLANGFLDVHCCVSLWLTLHYVFSSLPTYLAFESEAVARTKPAIAIAASSFAFI